MKNVGILFLTIVLVSCSRMSVEKRLMNKSWTIMSGQYQGKDFGLFFFRWNCFTFKSQNHCDLPYFMESAVNSKWQLISVEGSEDFRIRISNSEDKFLDNEYSCKFMNDDIYLDKLILKSDSLILICTTEK